MNTGKAKFAINSHTQAIVNHVAKLKDIALDDAFREFMNSHTYALLLDFDSHLYSKSRAYIIDMYQCELTNDWKNWLEV
ncbi:MAG: hypothetical protein FWE90_00640 [Defluviitaleaceae bacterium]|nr:hypothetical protein [Defluviitaleaceae bacterium]